MTAFEAGGEYSASDGLGLIRVVVEGFYVRGFPKMHRIFLY